MLSFLPVHDYTIVTTVKNYLVLFVTLFDTMCLLVSLGVNMPTDFSKILEALREWGFNDYKMSELTGVERSKLSYFRTGKRKNPSYDDGVAIMEIYKKESKKHS